MEPLNIETERERLEHVGWRKMALELRKKLPHLTGRKRSKLLLQPSTVTGVRANRLTYRRLWAAIALISLAVNVWVMGITLPGYKAKAAKVDVLKSQVAVKQRTINHLADENAYLTGEVKKDVQGLEARYNRAIKGAEKAEADYEKLFSEVTK